MCEEIVLLYLGLQCLGHIFHLLFELLLFKREMAIPLLSVQEYGREIPLEVGTKIVFSKGQGQVFHRGHYKDKPFWSCPIRNCRP